jgi:hypothetical protein
MVLLVLLQFLVQLHLLVVEEVVEQQVVLMVEVEVEVDLKHLQLDQGEVEILLQQLQLKVKMVDQVITLQDQQKQEAVVAQELLVKMEQEVQHHQMEVLMV